MSTSVKIVGEITMVKGCLKDCPHVRWYGWKRGCSFTCGPLPETGVPDWCTLPPPEEKLKRLKERIQRLEFDLNHKVSGE